MATSIEIDRTLLYNMATSIEIDRTLLYNGIIARVQTHTDAEYEDRLDAMFREKEALYESMYETDREYLIQLTRNTVYFIHKFENEAIRERDLVLNDATLDAETRKNRLDAIIDKWVSGIVAIMGDVTEEIVEKHFSDIDASIDNSIRNLADTMSKMNDALEMLVKGIAADNAIN
jgi:hypothetical protein